MTRVAALVAVSCLLAAARGEAAPSSWKTLHGAAGFRVSAPGDWKADTEAYQEDFTGDDASSPRTPLFGFVPTAELDPGSTLASNSVGVFILPLPAGRNGCTAANFFALMPPDYALAADIDTPDYAHASEGDPGDWYTTELYAWRLSENPCVGVQYSFTYAADDSDQAKGEKPFDRTKLLALLDAIRATIARDPKP